MGSIQVGAWATSEGAAPPLLVACLCAQWCGTCRDFASVFEQLRQQGAARWGADVVFAWIDVEDEADALGLLDIETFPTLLVAEGETPLFFGPVLPQLAPAMRLIAHCLDRSDPHAADRVEAPAGLVQFARRLALS
jgi:thiol-disulfide isomerase/thioredoxin